MTTVREQYKSKAVYYHSSYGPYFGSDLYMQGSSTWYTSNSYYHKPYGMSSYRYTGQSSIRADEMEVFYVY